LTILPPTLEHEFVVDDPSNRCPWLERADVEERGAAERREDASRWRRSPALETSAPPKAPACPVITPQHRKSPWLLMAIDAAEVAEVPFDRTVRDDQRRDCGCRSAARPGDIGIGDDQRALVVDEAAVPGTFPTSASARSVTAGWR
jgi:hypothetical protein